MRITPPLHSAALLVAAIWLCFLTKAVFYSSLIPVWEGYDESSHFDFVEYLTTVHRLPDVRSATGSRAVADSLQLAPVPWTIRDERPGEISQDEFWRLPAQMRLARDRALRAVEGDRARDPAKPGLPLYEAQQPPLAYLVFLPVFLAFRHASLLSQAWVLRIAGSLIASLAIPLAFLIGRRIFRNDWRAAGLTAVIAAMPELIILISHAGNEPLALVAGSACIYWLIRMASGDKSLVSASTLGAVLGCSLLTKAYFLALIPPVCATCAVLWLRDRGRRSEIMRQLGIVLGLALAIAGWWYARNLSITGTLSGELTHVVAQRSGVPMLQALARANWLRAADFALTTHVWLGGWSFLVLRGWMYRAVAAVLAASFAGMAVLVMRKDRGPTWRGPLLICGVVTLFFWIGLADHAMAGYRFSGKAATMGYYAYCVVAAEAVCLIAGIAALLPRPAGRFVVPSLTAGFAALEIYGAVFLLLPYYGGFTAHSARGSVPAMHLGQLAGGGIDRLFQNLALCKPWFLPAPVLAALFVCYLLAVCGIVGIGFLLARREAAIVP